MKNIFYLLFPFLIVFVLSCSDDIKETAKPPNTLSANIDSAPWTSSMVYSQRSLKEKGPLTIVASGNGYTMEIVLGGINEEGEYNMGTNRTGKIKLGNNTYSTLDVQDAGKIVISNFSENRIIGQFFFNAQWLSANNRIEVTEGSFDVDY